MSEVMDGGKEAGLRILLQLALDEMQHVVEAVNDRHDKHSNHLKYTTPYGAINGMIKVREDILVQCAMWGIEVSPKRPVPPNPTPEAPMSDAEPWRECGYCGEACEPTVAWRTHECKQSSDAVEAARRLTAQLDHCDLSDPFDYDLSLVLAATAHLSAEREELREVLQAFIYETTHLSAQEDDGSHRCKISVDTLRRARKLAGDKSDD